MRLTRYVITDYLGRQRSLDSLPEWARDVICGMATELHTCEQLLRKQADELENTNKRRNYHYDDEKNRQP